MSGFEFASGWRQWRLALAVWQQGSAAQAATVFPVSVSSVARAVQWLEQQLGVPLFERQARGMTASRAAQVILPQVQRAFTQLGLADAELQAWRRAPSGAAPAASLGVRHVRVLLAVLQQGSETLAAAQLGVSQPAVQQALAQLEHRVQCRLFDRVARGLRPTAAALCLAKRVRLALAEFRQAQEAWDWSQGHQRGRLVIGALPLSSGGLVPQAAEALLQRYPALHITVVDGTYDTLLQGLRQAEVDVIVGALRYPAPASDVCQSVLFTDTLGVMACADHPVLQRPGLTLAELLAQAWITPLAATPARLAFDQAFRAQGLAPPPDTLSSNSPAVIRALLLESQRLALVSPALLARELALGLVRQVPVAVTGTERHIGITLRTDQQPSAALLALIGQLRQAGV